MTEQKRPKTEFKKWVFYHGGVTHLARQMGLSSHAINQWLRQEASPTAQNIKKLIELSEGELTFEIIVRDTEPRSKQNTTVKKSLKKK